MVKRDSQAAALKLGIKLNVLYVSDDAELEEAFKTFRQSGAGALVIGTDGFFNNRLEQLATLAICNSVCLRVMNTISLWQREGWLATGAASQIHTASLAGMWAAFSRARNPLTCPSNRQARSSCL